MAVIGATSLRLGSSCSPGRSVASTTKRRLDHMQQSPVQQRTKGPGMDAEALSKLAYLQQRGLELLQRKAKLQKARTGFDTGRAEGYHKKVRPCTCLL